MSEAIVKKEQINSLATVTPKVVKELICKSATDSEIGLFLNICKNNGLDPFKREIYLVKYGTNPAMSVTGYEVYLKRAQSSGVWNGFKVWTEGSLSAKNLVAKCEIYRKDWDKPFYWEVGYEEGLSLNNPIAKSKPKHMLKKTCMSQAFRLCFPEQVGGLPYTADEMGAEEPLSVDYEVVKEQSTPKATPKENTVKVEPKVPTEPVAEVVIDIFKDKYGGASPHRDKVFIDIPLGYLENLTKPEFFERFTAPKQDAIKRTIAYLKEKEAKLTSAPAEPEVVDDSPIGELTPSSKGEDLIFTDAGEVSTIAEVEKVVDIKATETEWQIKLAGREWEIEDTKKGEPAPEALIELVDGFLKATTLFTPIEKEKMYDAITKMKRNMAIAQYNQIKTVFNKRYKIAYGE